MYSLLQCDNACLMTSDLTHQRGLCIACCYPFLLCVICLQELNQDGVMNETLSDNSAKALLCVLPCLVFLYVNAVMMFALLSKPLLLGCPRYILFGHLLLCDSLQLVLAMLLYIFAIGSVRMNSHVCLLLSSCAAIAVKMSPLTLAAMSSERYIAICFPLRHADIVTARMAGVVIAFIWTVGSIDSCTQLFLFVSLQNKSVTMPNFCNKNLVLRQQIFSNSRTVVNTLCFVFVSVIIIYTYIAVMVTVKSACAHARSATKASKTLLLHLIQLLLCLTSTLFTEMNSSNMWNTNPSLALNIQYALFVAFIIFPKCLSPLIYGVRDNTFQLVFKYYFTFGLECNPKTCPQL